VVLEVICYLGHVKKWDRRLQVLVRNTRTMTVVDYWVNVFESRGTSSPGLSWIQGLRVVVPAYPCSLIKCLSLCTETSRQSDWDGIVSCHRGEKVATTWNFNRSTMGSHRLQHRRFTDDAKSHRHTSALVQLLLTY